MNFFFSLFNVIINLWCIHITHFTHSPLLALSLSLRLSPPESRKHKHLILFSALSGIINLEKISRMALEPTIETDSVKFQVFFVLGKSMFVFCGALSAMFMDCGIYSMMWPSMIASENSKLIWTLMSLARSKFEFSYSNVMALAVRIYFDLLQQRKLFIFRS